MIEDSVMIEYEYPLLPVGFVRPTLRSVAGAPRKGSDGATEAWLVLDDGAFWKSYPYPQMTCATCQAFPKGSRTIARRSPDSVPLAGYRPREKVSIRPSASGIDERTKSRLRADTLR